jgi:uncharacterized protein (DUF58 family)
MGNRRNIIYTLIAGALVVGLFTGRSVFFNLGALLFALLVVSAAWSWLALRGIGIARITRAQRLQVGANLEETFVITNRALLPKLWLEIEDDSTLPGYRAGHVVSALAPRGQYRWDTVARVPARGEYRLGPMSVSTGDPFGLYAPRRTLAATSTLIVYPLIQPITAMALPGYVYIGGDSERRPTERVTANPIGVRSYMARDSFNRIDWKSSARSDALMVKKYETEPTADLWIFLDLAASSHIDGQGLRRAGERGYALPNDEVIPPSTEEYAIVAAVSLAQFFAQEGKAFGLTAYMPERFVFSPDEGGLQRLRISEALATARALSPLTLTQMLAAEHPVIARSTTYIIITASADPAWPAECAALAARGIQPFVVLIDPASFAGVQSIATVRAELSTSGVPSIVLRRGDHFTAAFAQMPL